MYGPSEAKIRANRENAKKAQLARKLKTRDKQVKKLDEKISDLKGEVEARVAVEVKNRMAEISDRKFLKEQFLGVFMKLGGAEGLYKWAKSNQANLKEYYKMFAAMLKAESEAAAARGGNGGGVTVNLFGLYDDDMSKTIDIRARKDPAPAPDHPRPDNGLVMDFDAPFDPAEALDPMDLMVDDLCR